MLLTLNDLQKLTYFKMRHIHYTLSEVCIMLEEKKEEGRGKKGKTIDDIVKAIMIGVTQH